MKAIEQCRTEQLGGHVYRCDRCQVSEYSYHSCRNRHCPKCQTQAGQVWLERQQQLLLPTPYFMVTFTLPEPLRLIARSHQKVMYSLLFQTAAAALQQLAQAPRFVGGADRHDRGAAHLGTRFELSSAPSFSGTGWGTVSQWPTVAGLAPPRF